MFAGILLMFAAAAPSLDGSEVIETITVEAAKLPVATHEITGNVTLISSARMEHELAQSIGDLIRYEPGVDVVDQGSRFGLAGISIRGVGGNRVKLEVDGVAASDAFSIGSFSNASRDFVDVDSLKQVEIVRGPASAMFGSDALGGVVSFVTKGPHDLLATADQYLDFSAGYNSVDDSTLVRATGAVRLGTLAGMVRVNARQGDERDNPLADPMQDDSQNLLLRLEWGTHGNGALALAVERFRADTKTQVDTLEGVQDFSGAFGFPYVINTSEVRGDDRRERFRAALGQEWLGGAFGTDYLRWRAYAQDSDTAQQTFEARDSVIGGVATAVTRVRDFNFQQQLFGIEVNAASDIQFASLSHQLSYGLEFERTDTEQLRDGIETNLATGVVSKQVGPDLYPVRDFPESRARRTGLYLQDRIILGPIALTPGLRWDRYALNPAADAIFVGDNPGVGVEGLDDEQLSPKIGALWSISEQWNAYLQYAEGFRAPPVNDVNVGFTNLQFGYTSLPNPELKSESSAGYELGVRYSGERLVGAVAVFETRYDDFIESFQVVGFDPVNQLLQFQSINVDSVEIRGAEMQGRLNLLGSSDQLSLTVALAYAEGEDRTTGLPVNSIAPFNGVIGLDYRDPDRRFGLSVMARGAASQSDLDESDGALFQPSGYIVFDTFGFWQPSQSVRVRAGLYNLTNRSYTPYLDVAGLPSNSVDAQRYQRPGRNFSVALDWTF